MALLRALTEGGIVEGLPSLNQSVSVFKGVPFAAPPVGELRWKAPQPVVPWDGVRTAYKFAPTAMQIPTVSEGGGNQAQREFFVIQHPMSEDCLYLNIWTPARTDSERLPVAVYFHGGGNFTGYSYLQAYDGDGFAKRGIVYVSIAHRLHMLGFMAHPELTAEDPNHSSGNYGSLDMVEALKWIKRNIEAFGGDPENITIFGQSAGGQNVTTMCVSPLTKGLFKRAIIQSAGHGPVSPPESYWELSLKNAEEIGIEFFEYAGFKFVKEARRLPCVEQFELMTKFQKERHPMQNVLNIADKNPGNTGNLLRFIPTVDGYFFLKTPLESFQSNEYHDIDYMAGCTKDEYLTYTPKIPDIEVLKARAKAEYKHAADEYLKVIRPEEPDYCIWFFENIMGDNKLAGNLALCEMQNQFGRKPAYIYYFTLVPPGAENSHHSAEHHYVFQTFPRSKRPYSGKDFDLSNLMADYWANFIKTGDPNAAGLPEWNPYTQDSPLGMEFNYEPKMIKIPEKPNVTFRKNYLLGRI